MENGMWKGVIYAATDIVEVYGLEKQIRKASGIELRCPDPNCQNPILKYCHGTKRTTPYFSHLNNCSCDYTDFDKGNTQLLRQVKRRVYENLTNRGFHVTIEPKILPHHYTHLLVSLSDEKKIAIELGTPKTTAKKIDDLMSQYREIGIDVKWIIVDDDHSPVEERDAYFLKRYLLNEANSRDVLQLDWNGSSLTQYVCDPNRYEYKGRVIHSDNYPKIYSQNADISQLTIENGELTIAGFFESYNDWLIQKSKAFEKKKAVWDEEDRKWEQEQIELREREEQRRRELKAREEDPRRFVTGRIELPQPDLALNRKQESLASFVAEFWRPSVLSIRCKFCGELKPKNAFYEYEYDKGVCNDCKRERSKKAP